MPVRRVACDERVEANLGRLALQRGPVIVWIPRTAASARPLPFPTIATESRVSSSPGHSGMSPNKVNDGEEPVRSSGSGSRYDWWPRKGTTEWVQHDFEKEAAVSEVEVRAPQSWRILFLEGSSWKAVETVEACAVDRDGFNRVNFRPLKTKALRLEMTAQPDWSIGIQEWRVR